MKLIHLLWQPRCQNLFFQVAYPSAMAYTVIQKYVKGMPLYRQEKHLDRFGISISRQTLSNWIVYSCNLAWDTSQRHERLLDLDALHADKTTLQVLSEPEWPATSTSYMRLYHSGQSDVLIVLYDYQKTRASNHPRKFLEDFQGYLHVDGYAGYNSLPLIILVRCWALARRKFTEALKALPESAKTNVKAKKGLAFCNQLFTNWTRMKGR